MSELTLHQESLASVAIDGARINCFLAINLVAMDGELDGAQKAELLNALSHAADALDYARETFPVVITSLHHATLVTGHSSLVTSLK